MSVRYIVADVFDGLATLEDGSVDLVVTSPPFLQLRSYLPADHPDKSKEIGSEATPAEFLDVLLRVTAELRRVLAPHGSICVELGDTYAGTGGAGGDWSDSEMTTKARVPGGSDGGPPRRSTMEGWPLTKSKALIPELYRIALAYGINPLTGQESPAGRWRIRNVVTWCRPNPPVGALGDKWRPATSDIVIACTSDKRYWDDIATRREVEPQTQRNTNGPKAKNSDRSEVLVGFDVRIDSNPAGAPLLDWHSPLADAIDRAAAEGFALGRHTTEPLFGEATNEVKETIGQRMLRELVEQGAIDSGDVLYLPPGGYRGTHYAVYPPALVERLIKAMAPPKVCRTCGEPSRRIMERETRGKRVHAIAMDRSDRRDWNAERPTDVVVRGIGWTDCGHNNWRPAVVLDPFAGTGTTLAVATGHGHDAIGIDIDERNRDLAYERIGPLLWQEEAHAVG